MQKQPPLLHLHSLSHVRQSLGLAKHAPGSHLTIISVSHLRAQVQEVRSFFLTYRERAALPMTNTV